MKDSDAGFRCKVQMQGSDAGLQIGEAYGHFDCLALE
jgi:hypothetical protein